MLGMHGSAFANYAVQECDLLISVGAGLTIASRATWHLRPNAKIIHIDIDPAPSVKTSTWMSPSPATRG